MPRAALLAFLLVPLPAGALELAVPGAPELVVEEVVPLGRHALPVGPWAAGELPVRTLEGEITRQVWHLRGGGIGNLQIIRPLREQLLAQGLSVLLDCEARVCGGFDFRFAVEVLPPPQMQVDLASFHFLSAEGAGPDGPEAVDILVSAGGEGAFVQIIRIAPEGGQLRAAPAPGALGAPAGAGPAGGDPAAVLAATLESTGRVILSDLAFPTGSAQLGEGEFASLEALAAYLRADPSRRVVLVGHTDAQGALETNITLSRRRAASVMERLAAGHDVPRRQMQAEGVGWLAPIASNLAPDGREANRRVEVVLIDGE